MRTITVNNKSNFITQPQIQEMSKGLDYISVRIYRRDGNGNILINGSGLLFENNGGYFVFTNFHCVSSKDKVTDVLIPIDISLTEIAFFYGGKQVDVKIDKKIDDSESEDWILFSVYRPDVDWDYTSKVRFATNISTGSLYETYPYVTEYEGYGRYTPIVATNPFGMWHVADQISGGRYAADQLMKGGSGSGIMQFHDDVFYCYGILQKALNDGAFSDLKSVGVSSILPLLSKQTTIQLTEEDVEQLNKTSIGDEVNQLKSTLSSYVEPEDLHKALLKLLEEVIPSLLNNYQDTLALSLLECIETLCTSERTPDTIKAAYHNCKGEYYQIIGSMADATKCFQEAYTLVPDKNKYIEHEVRRLLTAKQYDDVKEIVVKLLEDNHLRLALNLVDSESPEEVFHSLSPELQGDIKLRYTIIGIFSQAGKNYRFLTTGVMPTIPDNLTVENTYLWLYAFECYRNRIGDYLLTDMRALPAGKLSLIQDAYNLAVRFFKQADATCSASLYANLRMYFCYWAFFVETSNKTKWIDRIEAIEATDQPYSLVFKTLFKSSMLAMIGDYEGAFIVIRESGIAYDDIVLPFIVSLCCTSRTPDFLLSLIPELKEKDIQFDSQLCASMASLLCLVDPSRHLSIIEALPIKQEADAIVLKWLHSLAISQKVDTSGYEDLLPHLCDDMVANLAQVMAANGMRVEAYNILDKRFAVGDGSFCEQVYSALISEDPERHIDHYALLRDSRHQGNAMTSDQLRQEYNYALSMLDYDNALEVLEILRAKDRTDEYVLTAYVDVIGKHNPDRLIELYETVMKFCFNTVLHIQQVYYAFASNKYIEQAAEFLYQNTIRLNHEALNAYYDQQVIMGFLNGIANLNYDVVEADNYVTYANEQDVRSCRKFSPDSVLGSAMIGAKVGDIITIDLGGTPTKLKIIGIHNKYYKLHADNMKDVIDSGGNSFFTPIKIDFTNPDTVPEQLESILKELSGGVNQPTEQEIYEDYDLGLLTLIQMASVDNILGSYYNFLFSKFHLNVAPYGFLRENCSDLFSKENSYVLDLTSLLLLFEFSQKNDNYQYHTRFLLPKYIQQLVQQTAKGVEIYTCFKMVDALNQGWLNRYSSKVDEDIQIRLKALSEWIDQNCTIVNSPIVLNMAPIPDEGVKSAMLKYTLLELLPAAGPNRILLSEDAGIHIAFKMPVPIMSTEAYMYYAEGEYIGQLFSQFLCNNTCIGASVSTDYILQQYKLLESHSTNHIEQIEETISRSLNIFGVLDATKLIIAKANNMELALSVVEKLIRSVLMGFEDEFFDMQTWSEIIRRESLSSIGRNHLIPILMKVKDERMKK